MAHETLSVRTNISDWNSGVLVTKACFFFVQSLLSLVENQLITFFEFKLLLTNKTFDLISVDKLTYDFHVTLRANLMIAG